jgi:hypothetical protein
LYRLLVKCIIIGTINKFLTKLLSPTKYAKDNKIITQSMLLVCLTKQFWYDMYM